MVDVAIFMSNSSFSMEKTFLGQTLKDRTIWELDDTEALPGRFVLVSFPLTLILPTFTDVHLERVPVVTFTTALGAQLISKIIICKKCLLGSNELSFEIDWLLLSSNSQ